MGPLAQTTATSATMDNACSLMALMSVSMARTPVQCTPNALTSKTATAVTVSWDSQGMASFVKMMMNVRSEHTHVLMSQCVSMKPVASTATAWMGIAVTGYHATMWMSVPLVFLRVHRMLSAPTRRVPSTACAMMATLEMAWSVQTKTNVRVACTIVTLKPCARTSPGGTSVAARMEPSATERDANLRCV
eukprot:Rmarinus@m.26007